MKAIPLSALLVIFSINILFANIIPISIDGRDTCGSFTKPSFSQDTIKFSNGVTLSMESATNGIVGAGSTNFFFLAFLDDDIENSSVCYKYHTLLKRDTFNYNMPDPAPYIFFSRTHNNPDVHFNDAKKYPEKSFESDKAIYEELLNQRDTCKYTAIPLFTRGYTDPNMPYFCDTYSGYNNIAYVKKEDAAQGVTHVKIQMSQIVIDFNQHMDPEVKSMTLRWSVDGNGDGEFTDQNSSIIKPSAQCAQPRIVWSTHLARLSIDHHTKQNAPIGFHLFNQLGKRLISSHIHQGQTIDVSHLGVGHYIIEAIDSRNGNTRQKIAIVK